MDCLTIERTTFLPQNDGQEITSKTDNLCIRFLRKKYKCLLLWGLSILSLSQTFFILFEKIDNGLLNKAVGLMFTNNTNNESELKTQIYNMSILVEKLLKNSIKIQNEVTP